MLAPALIGAAGLLRFVGDVGNRGCFVGDLVGSCSRRITGDSESSFFLVLELRPNPRIECKKDMVLVFFSGCLRINRVDSLARNPRVSATLSTK